jgi:hypothetical protein
MPNNRPLYLISISQDIVDNLQLNDFTQILQSKLYLKFVADTDDISIENNYSNTSIGVQQSFNRVLLQPKPILRKFVIKFRESRYEFKLALEEIAKRSQRAYINNDSDQLISLLDYNMPEYNDFVVRGQNEAYTIRNGYIPVDSVTSQGNLKSSPYIESYAEFGNLIATTKIGITFYETKPRY